MTLTKSRFNHKLIYFSVAGLVSSLLISLALLQAFAFLLFILWIFEKNKLEVYNRLFYGFMGFGVVRLISIIFSEYFDASLVAVQKELLFYFTLTALYFYLRTFDHDQIIKLIKVFIHVGALVALIGIILFAIGKFDRAQSFGSGYATYSTYLVVILMFILSLRSNKSYKILFIWVVEVSLIITGIILSMGRANIVIAIVLALAIIFLRRISLKEIILFVILSTVFTLITLQFNTGESEKRISNPTTLSDRDILYEGFYDLAGEHPVFGFGPRTFHEIFPYKERLADKKVGSWHNDYIQIYLESGIFAIIIFLGIVIYMLQSTGWVIFKPRRLSMLETEKFAVLFGIVAILSAGLTGTFFLSPVLSILFAYLISLFSYFWYIGKEAS